jgi:peroxiredoxin
MKKLCTIILFAAIALATTAQRKSPEFTISVPGGKDTLLSSYRGKVVLIGFFSTACPHCQNTAKVFGGLQQAFGSEGLQAVGIAFNPETKDDAVVKDFARNFAPNFPVGRASLDSVLSYLGISVMDRRWVYPQVVLIDRHGMIREQSDPKGSPELQDLVTLRPKVEALLKER